MLRLASQDVFHPHTVHIRENASQRFSYTNSVLNSANIQTRNTFEHEEINNLSTAYVRGEITDDQFRTEFAILLESREIQAQIDIEQQGTNILRVLQKERDWRVLLRDLPNDKQRIEHILALYPNSALLQEYVQTSLGLNFIENFSRIAEFLSIPENRMQLYNQEINVSIDVLTGGGAAFAIDDSAKHNRTYQA